MQRQIRDQDIKPLIKLTLLTPTNQDIFISIPFFKKFTPEVPIKPEQLVYLPLFHVITLSTAQNYAQIDLYPLLQYLNQTHVISVQTYNKIDGSPSGQSFSLNLQFSQTVVWDNQANSMRILIKRLVMIPNKAISNIEIKITTSHSYSWRSPTIPMQESISLQEQVTMQYQNILDSVYFQLWSGNNKICEQKMYVFQLIDGGTKIIDLKGTLLKAQLKVITKNAMPIISIE